MKYWLMKTEPAAYGWDDLKKADDQTDCWDGVRNYQARNYMREMEQGDMVFFYHSQSKPNQIMGVAKVVKEAYADHTQFDSNSKYFDPKSTEEEPRWQMVDIKRYKDFDPPVTVAELRETPGLEEMMLLRRGIRFSVQPVTAEEAQIILGLRNIS